MDNQLSKILLDAILEQEPFMEEPLDLSSGDNAELYSETGQLDSLSLITIISTVEKKLFLLTGEKVKLANEQDLSFLNSPFKTFGSMLGFIKRKVYSNDNALMN
ncbi:TPA: hypothetical protein U2M30_003887 [Providencia stuartii]|uniref:hypothetical protein n=1 Tax=Providencia stuartii TaxID=588 RepID=UPI00123AA33E|nr:hypothetical protein [Providencia stuartii]QET97369.1 hypothetical protein FOB53_08920 [Providencia stuartii]UQZ12942.1 hypothetical protein M8G38_05020 [Providencia stuartii]HEM8145632.1 hypothetical protein [Providencia stuartii]HEM8876204.1 hypothetical protein [Providencia stuartii]